MGTNGDVKRGKQSTEKCRGTNRRATTWMWIQQTVSVVYPVSRSSTQTWKGEEAAGYFLGYRCLVRIGCWRETERRSESESGYVVSQRPRLPDRGERQIRGRECSCPPRSHLQADIGFVLVFGFGWRVYRSEGSKSRLIFRHYSHHSPLGQRHGKRPWDETTYRDECELDWATEVANNLLAGDFPTPRSSRSSTCFTRGVTVLVRFLTGLFIPSPGSMPRRCGCMGLGCLLDDATGDEAL